LSITRYCGLNTELLTGARATESVDDNFVEIKYALSLILSYSNFTTFLMFSKNLSAISMASDESFRLKEVSG